MRLNGFKMSLSTLSVDKEIADKIAIVCILTNQKRKDFVKEALDKAIKPYMERIVEMRIK